jgi:CheY-like chemotaxis protein/DNA-directed RNA polymerase specialized sigma24 family protein
MSLYAAGIIDQLPSLRRYAAALMGSAARADGMVERFLERLLADRTRVAGDQLRLTMFALFDLVVEQARDPIEADMAPGSGPEHRLNQSLRRLPIDERKVLLLTTVERFSHIETAAILRIPPALVARRVLAARDRLEHTLCSRILIIEDEPLMAMSIAQILTHMGHAVCGVAHARHQALALARDSRPALILADVWLHGGDDGIAIVREIVRSRPVPVIFVTGDVRCLVAERQLGQALVIGKPFAPHTLEAAVRGALGSTMSSMAS